MNSQLHLIDFPKVNSHIHFIEDKSELAEKELEGAKEGDAKKENEQKVNVPSVDEIVELTQEKKKAYKRLHEQIGKYKNYDKVLHTLNMQKLLMVRQNKRERIGKGKKKEDS